MDAKAEDWVVALRSKCFKEFDKCKAQSLCHLEQLNGVDRDMDILKLLHMREFVGSETSAGFLHFPKDFVNDYGFIKRVIAGAFNATRLGRLPTIEHKIAPIIPDELQFIDIDVSGETGNIRGLEGCSPGYSSVFRGGKAVHAELFAAILDDESRVQEERKDSSKNSQINSPLARLFKCAERLEYKGHERDEGCWNPCTTCLGRVRGRSRTRFMRPTAWTRSESRV